MERFEREYGRRAIVARASVDSPYIDRLADKMGIHSLPTFILLSAGGEITRLEGWGASHTATIEKILSGSGHRSRR